MIRGKEQLCHEKRLRDMGLFSLEKKMLWGDPIAAFQYLKVASKKMGLKLFTRTCSNRTSGKGFKRKEGRCRLGMRKTFFQNEGDETLEEVAQRRGRCPLSGSIQDQVEWGFEQPGLVEGIPVHGSRSGTR